MSRLTPFIFLTAYFLPVLAAPVNEVVDVYAEASGREIIEAVYRRHQQYPHVYEEQSMILIDQQGHKNTRKLRRYSRVNEHGDSDFLLLFDSPREVKGVALLASRDASGETSQSFYLPAFGSDFIRNDTNSSNQQQDNFLGTDYSIDNLTGEMLDDYQYVRSDDLSLDDIDYYAIDVYPLLASDNPLRRHYIRKDTLFTIRTDHFDDLGRLKKRQTQHDLTNVHGDMWRANMMMMDNQIQNHRTIIKIDRRVFSADYVPAEVFTQAWIVANQPPPETETETETESDSDPEPILD